MTRLTLLSLLLCGSALAQDGERGIKRADPSKEPPQQWAILIGVKKHDETRLNLAFTLADAQRLRDVLGERAGIPSENILFMTDDAASEHQPTLANLRREIPAFLKRSRPNDHLLVFFAGHGFLHQGKTYLVPRDCKTSDLEKTGLPAEELRAALEKAEGKIKFLVLDCCHAGGARELPPTEEVAGESLAKSLNLGHRDGVVILASCKDKESSWEWAERRQGVFSYWLCRALEGAADANNDGVLDADEVYNYTHQRVSTTVSETFGRSQRPVRIIGPDVVGVSPVLRLRPESPDTLCRRLAENVDLEVRQRKLRRVGVLEFATTLGKTEKLARSNLPRYCARKIEAFLSEMAGNAYQVVSETQLASATRGMKWDDIGDPIEMKKLGQGTDALVTGTMRRRGGTLNVQCDLVRVADGSSLVTPSGVLPLSEDLLGDTGVSFDNRQRPVGSPFESAVLDEVQSRVAKGNPLLVKDFPFRIEIVTVLAKPGEKITPQMPRRPKQLTIIPGSPDQPDVRRELALGVRSGEIIEVRVTNDWIDTVAMTLLVDGINTIGQKPTLLGKGSAWLLQPGKTYPIAGWYLPKEKTVKRFQFVDLASSVAARERFGESIGLISAAFYAGHGRSLAVGEGPAERRDLKVSTDFRPGRLMGVVNLRYVEEKSLR